MSIEVRERPPVGRRFEISVRGQVCTAEEAELRELVEKGAKALGLAWWQAGKAELDENAALKAKLQRAREACLLLANVAAKALADLAEGGDDAPSESKTVCAWEQDRDDVWGTDCGHYFEFTEGTPEENKAKFCMFCGREIKAYPYVEEAVDDE